LVNATSAISATSATRLPALLAISPLARLRLGLLRLVHYVFWCLNDVFLWERQSYFPPIELTRHHVCLACVKRGAGGEVPIRTAFILSM
jgi:hypothetical protein